MYNFECRTRAERTCDYSKRLVIRVRQALYIIALIRVRVLLDLYRSKGNGYFGLCDSFAH